MLGFTDDFYDYRVYHGEQIGVVIRDGELLYNKPYSKRKAVLPNLDMMAQFEDGSFKTFECGSITAQELLNMGAVNVYCFGPILVRNGEIDPIVEGKYRERFPRQGFGMIEPNHYYLIMVQGRTTNSGGTNAYDLARMLRERGVVEALNLDGGNTMALVFRGRMLNDLARWKTRKYVRAMNSIFGIGVSETAIRDD